MFCFLISYNTDVGVEKMSKIVATKSIPQVVEKYFMVDYLDDLSHFISGINMS